MSNTQESQGTGGVYRAGFFAAARRRLWPLAVAAGLAAGAAGGRAGVLHDIYSGSMTDDADMSVAGLNARAADQAVTTEQRRYLPKVSVVARELWVYQDVRKSGNPVFPSGQDDYDNTRVNVELDQPIYDPTIRPLIEAAKARRRQVSSQGRQTSEWQTRLVVEGFLRSARFFALSRSAEEVIARLEKEKGAVTQSYDAKVATLSDVQNVELALASMKRERNNYTQQLYHELSALGVGEAALKAGWVRLDEKASTAALTEAVPDAKSQTAEIEGLQAEADTAANQGLAAKRRSLPVLSLYGQYGLFTAGGSEFGGAQNMSEYEVGLAVKWDIFDRGTNLSEAREFSYRKQAKEAELKALMKGRTKADAYSRELLDQANRSVGELSELLGQYAGLRDSAARAYAAGKESYINSITAYLAYEATARELLNARYDRLGQEAVYCGQTAGWNAGLVDKVDALFVAAK